MNFGKCKVTMTDGRIVIQAKTINDSVQCTRYLFHEGFLTENTMVYVELTA